MAHKLDVFKTLKSIDTKDRDFFSSLTEEERKGFAAFVVVQWLTGTKDPAQIYFINELVNPFIFAFGKHQELLYLLMCVCSSGDIHRYRWVKKKKISKASKSINVIKEYFGYNTIHARESLSCLTSNDIADFAEELGYQKEEIAKIKKEKLDG